MMLGFIGAKVLYDERLIKIRSERV